MWHETGSQFIVLTLLSLLNTFTCTNWEMWWSYTGISGPDFWGVLNHNWKLCAKGKRQSPVNIDPSGLLYDPMLKPIQVDTKTVSGLLANTGHDVRFLITSRLHHSFNLTAGPFSYKYTATDIVFHYGANDNFGSEHTVNGSAFPGEIQILSYNTNLYPNKSAAASQPHGMAGVSIFLKIGSRSSRELEKIETHLKQIKYRGANVTIPHLSLYNLFPTLDQYMTYEGSITSPGCEETVTWIVLNKPLYISKEQMSLLRRLNQGTAEVPRHPVANNFRPTQKLNGRSIRTNIKLSPESKECSMARQTFYQANINGLDGGGYDRS